MAGIDSNAKLVLHLNGTDGATTFPDASDFAHGNGTANGNVQVDTAQSKFGGASALFDGTGDYIAYADSADWDFGSNDMAIDCWVRFTSVGTNNTICARTTDGNSYMYWTFESGTSLRFRDYNSGNNIDFTRTVSVAINTWYHVAVSRSGSTFRMFLDGVQQGADYTNSNAFINRSVALDIGAMTQNGSYVMNGWIDEFRYSNGDSRYTANFTPEAAEYSGATDVTVTPTILTIASDIQSPTLNIDATVEPTILTIASEVVSPADVGNFVTVEPTPLDIVSSIESPFVVIDCTVTPTILTIASDIQSPAIPQDMTVTPDVLTIESEMVPSIFMGERLETSVRRITF